MSDVKQTYMDLVAGVLAQCDGWQHALPEHTEQASQVWAYVLAPLAWLHAEAAWRLQMERLAHGVTIAARDVEFERLGAELAEAQADAVRHGWERDDAREALERLRSAVAEAEG